MQQHKEYTLYKQIAQYLRIAFPSARFHYDYAGNNLSKAQSGMMRAIQHSKGFPDLTIINPAGGILFLELKAEGNNVFKKNGEFISDDHVAEQAQWITALQQAGYDAHFAVGFDQAQNYIDNFLKR